MDNSYVYILTNDKHTVLYIGVTTNLVKRILQHTKYEMSGFTQKYNAHKLVYYEIFDRVVDAIKREKQLKKWNRSWKIRLINAMNPEWRDLSDEFGMFEVFY